MRTQRETDLEAKVAKLEAENKSLLAEVNELHDQLDALADSYGDYYDD